MLACCLPDAPKHKVTPLEHELYSRGFHDTEDGFRLDVDKEIIRFALGEAFVDEPIMAWSMNHLPEFSSKQEQIDFVRFCNSFAFLEDLDAKNSFQLCETVDNGEDGDCVVVSAASVQEYDPVEKKHTQGPLAKFWHNWNMMTMMIRLLCSRGEKFPPVMEKQAEMKRLEQKVQKWVDEVDDWHLKYGPKGKHWYLHLVGCNPKFQGQGKGRKILTKLCEMADEMQMDIYLEAGGKGLASYYQKFGFQIQETIELIDPKDETSKSQVNLMTRAHAPS